MNSTTLTEHERRVAEAIAARTHHPDEGRALMAEIASIFSVSLDDMLSTKRGLAIVDARSVTTYILRERGWTNVEIGRLMRRDNATIWHWEQRIAKDFTLRRLAQELAA
jgi:chromosomal replication initiation ATPase DnaA